ncbi:MAG TPA: tyrosine-type recombinase/integrase, partial [Candidatus Eremiobacteraceae bacterium]|nr:tyrosine-type recombinase/integrase [Candidatus Eremiobacteraceae bacterium]
MKGSIFKRKGGYAVVIEQPPGPDGKRRQKWLRGGRTRKEAEKKLLEALRARERGPLIEDQKQTVSAFLDRWLANTERKVRLRTLARYRSLCDTLKTHIGHCRLLQLTPAALEDCYTKLLVSGRVVRAHCACGHTAGRHAKGKDSLGQCIVKKCSCDSFRPLPAMQNSDSNGGLSARTVLHCHRVLSLALKQAVRLGQLSSNPCGSVDPPRAARKEMRTLDPIEANSVIEAAKGTRLEFFVVLALATGARRGELLGLKWSDLDLGAGTVSFSRTLQSDKTTGELKTARSKRTLRLPKIAIDAARKHRATRIQER